MQSKSTRQREGNYSTGSISTEVVVFMKGDSMVGPLGQV